MNTSRTETSSKDCWDFAAWDEFIVIRGSKCKRSATEHFVMPKLISLLICNPSQGGLAVAFPSDKLGNIVDLPVLVCFFSRSL